MSIIVFDETNRKHLAWCFKVKKFKVEGGFVGSGDVQLLGSWNVS